MNPTRFPPAHPAWTEALSNERDLQTALRTMRARWSAAQINTAGHYLGMQPDTPWTLEMVNHAEKFLCAESGIRDSLKAYGQRLAACDALMQSLDELVEFAQNDVLALASGQPGGRTRDPDVWGMNNAYATVIDAVLAFADKSRVEPVAQAPAPSNAVSPEGAGLLTMHTPGTRYRA